jgi:SRSO17 transposase
MGKIHQSLASEAVSEPDGMFTIDGTDFQKYGTCSVGVARQYCGRLGKTASCQATVMLGYSGREGYCLLNFELFMPKGWFGEDYAKSGKKSQVPPEVVFKTKNQIAIDLLVKALKSGQFMGKWVGADAAFGHDHAFLDAIPKEVHYFADIHKDELFYTEKPTYALPERSGKGSHHT